MRYRFLAITACVFALSSCSEDKIDETPVGLTVPSEYVFTRNGQSSVDRSGQIQRQAMLTEIGTVMKGGASGTAFAASTLYDMFDNTNNPFNDADLNNSGKSLSSKTSASAVHVYDQGTMITRFKAMMQGGEAACGNTASAGQAGVISNAAGTRHYLVDGSGLEYVQAIQKGLMGACFLDQIVNNYLTDDKLNVDNEALVTGKNYTAMEHHWDEAFGYFSLVDTFQLDPSVSQARGFWGNYFMELEAEFGTASTTYEAFRKGRAAIVAKNYTVRDEQVDIIAAQFEKVTAIKSISYLNKAKASIASGELASGFHQMSEGIGFIFSLRYARDAKINDAQSDAFINSLIANDGFYSSDIASRIDAITAQITALMGFDASMSSGTY